MPFSPSDKTRTKKKCLSGSRTSTWSRKLRFFASTITVDVTKAPDGTIAHRNLLRKKEKDYIRRKKRTKFSRKWIIVGFSWGMKIAVVGSSGNAGMERINPLQNFNCIKFKNGSSRATRNEKKKVIKMFYCHYTTVKVRRSKCHNVIKIKEAAAASFSVENCFIKTIIFFFFGTFLIFSLLLLFTRAASLFVQSRTGSTFPPIRFLSSVLS